MPHQCTACERVLPGGSREMLGGCPDCGNNRFQYLPEGAAAADEGGAAPDPTEAQADSADEMIIASGGPVGGQRDTGGPESAAQVDARSSLVDPADLPSPETSDEPPEPETDPPAPTETVEALTDELSETFGSIRIVDRGEYELNLMELYEQDACIIQLEEDGRYMIDVPDMFQE